MKNKSALADAKWSEVRAEIHAILIEIARAGQIITYSELTGMLQTAYVHYHSHILVQLLTDIGSEEVAAGHPILPALVVAKQTGRPGPGYFKLAPGEEEMDDPLADWTEEVKRVHAFWSQS
jgi:hypothetical protein